MRQGHATGGNFDAPAVWNHYPTEDGDPSLSHAGAATEPLAEFDPVAYLNAALREARADRRHDRAQWFAYGASVGIVVFSIALGVWG